MTTLNYRLNMASGDVSSELYSTPFIVINKKTMSVSDIAGAIYDISDVEDIEDSELLDTAYIIDEFSSSDNLPFGGEMTIWFDASA